MITIDQIVQRIRGVPSLPVAVLRLIEVVNDPDSTVHDIVEVVQYDSGLTARLLRLCNSAFLGLSRRISSLHEAIRYLGTVRVLQLIISMHSSALLSRPQNGYGLDPGVLWTHSVAVALASAAFGQRAGLKNANTLFTAGLLHDIGKVVLNEYVAAEFSQIMQLTEQQTISFSEAEKQVLGFSHDEAGGVLAETWQLPVSIVNCIRYHHDPAALSPPEPTADMVYCGEMIATCLGLGSGSDGLSYRAHEQVLERHGIQEVDFERIGIQTATELARIQRMFAETDAPAAEWKWAMAAQEDF